MEGNVMTIVGVFIAIVIMLGIGTQILGNTSFQLFSNINGGQGAWVTTCESVQSDSQAGYQLLVIIIIVIAAVGISICSPHAWVG